MDTPIKFTFYIYLRDEKDPRVFIKEIANISASGDMLPVAGENIIHHSCGSHNAFQYVKGQIRYIG